MLIGLAWVMCFRPRGSEWSPEKSSTRAESWAGVVALKNIRVGNCLAVQRLGLRAFTAKGPVSIPGWGTKIPQNALCGQKKKKIRVILLQHGCSWMLREGMRWGERADENGSWDTGGEVIEVQARNHGGLDKESGS